MWWNFYLEFAEYLLVCFIYFIATCNIYDLLPANPKLQTICFTGNMNKFASKFFNETHFLIFQASQCIKDTHSYNLPTPSMPEARAWVKMDGLYGVKHSVSTLLSFLNMTIV